MIFGGVSKQQFLICARGGGGGGMMCKGKSLMAYVHSSWAQNFES